MTEIDDIWEVLNMHFEGPIPNPYTYPASFEWYIKMYALHKKVQINSNKS